MDKNDIIASLAKKKAVEEIIENIAGTSDPDLSDLAQDLYLDLLKKDEARLREMNENGSLQFFLTRMVLNNLHSKNSPYYYKYKKNNMRRAPLTEARNKESDDRQR